MLKINQIQFITDNNSLSVNIIWNFLFEVFAPFRAQKFN